MTDRCLQVFSDLLQKLSFHCCFSFPEPTEMCFIVVPKLVAKAAGSSQESDPILLLAFGNDLYTCHGIFTAIKGFFLFFK